MTRPFVYFIEIKDPQGGFTLARWQTRWIEQTISWEAVEWRYMPGLTASGVVSGQTIGSQASIIVPFTSETYDLAKKIASPPGIAIARKYDLVDAVDTSQMVEIGNYMGQVTQIIRTDVSITFNLGLAISPIGASFPPRTVTTELIGNGMIQI